MEALKRFVHWKESAKKEHDEIIGFGSFLLYSKYFSRAIYVLGLVYAVIFTKYKSIQCQSLSNDIKQSFLQKMCILPYFAAHGQHLDNSDGTISYGYYIWLYLVVLFLSFLAYFPLDLFRYFQSYKLEKLSEIKKIIMANEDYKPKYDGLSEEMKLPDRDSFYNKNNDYDQSELEDNFPDENELIEMSESDEENEIPNYDDDLMDDDDDESMEPDSTTADTFPEKEDRADKKEQLRLIAKSTHRALAIQVQLLDITGGKRFVLHYLVAHFLALLCIVAQVASLNFLFHGHFWHFGVPLVLHCLGMTNDGHNLTRLVFPFLTTCHFKTFGISGTVQNVDSLCLLNFNPLNRYIFVALWICLALMFVTMSISFLYKLVYVLIWHASRQKNEMQQKAKYIADAFQHVTNCSNINALYDCDLLLHKVYFWPLLMLKFTNIDDWLLEEKLRKFSFIMKDAGKERILERLEKKIEQMAVKKDK